MDFALELDLLLVAKRGVPFRETSLAPEKQSVPFQPGECADFRERTVGSG